MQAVMGARGMNSIPHRNKKYNLYRSAPEPGISEKGKSEYDKRWNLLMNCLQRDLKEGLSILDISIKYQIKYSDAEKYIEQWKSRKLINLVDLNKGKI